MWTDVPTTLLLETYANRLVEAGAAPLLLFAGTNPIDIVDHLDGIVLIGGQDVDPQAYGEEPGPSTQAPDPRRDAFESALALMATQRDLPLLAICRGHQVLNVTRGGTLHQHLPDVVGHTRHSPGRAMYGRTHVEIEPDVQTGWRARCHVERSRLLPPSGHRSARAATWSSWPGPMTG